MSCSLFNSVESPMSLLVLMNLLRSGFAQILSSILIYSKDGSTAESSKATEELSTVVDDVNIRAMLKCDQKKQTCVTILHYFQSRECIADVQNQTLLYNKRIRKKKQGNEKDDTNGTQSPAKLQTKRALPTHQCRQSDFAKVTRGVLKIGMSVSTSELRPFKCPSCFST